jgi:hypothetical protein
MRKPMWHQNNLVMKSIWTLILAATLSGGAAFAQSEQWLEYHTGEGRAYHQVEISTNPPPGIALPKLNGQVYFGRWVTPMDPAGGRWFCLDRSRKSGPCDRLFIDSNGNGRLDDKTPVRARIDSVYAIFPPSALIFKGEDGPITYHLAFRLYQPDQGPPQFLAAAAGWYEGLVNFDGAKKRLELIDGNVNGTFNDFDPDPYSSDRIQIEGDNVGERFLGQMLEVNGKFFRIETARDGACVKVRKLENVTLGTVKVPAEMTDFGAFGENGYFVRKPAKGEFTLPVGKYRMVRWTMQRQEANGRGTWTLSGRQFPNTANFEVAADTPATLEVGEPIQAILTATNTVGREILFSLRFEGRQKESIEMLREGQRPRGPKLTLTDAGGKLSYTTSFEFG